MIHYCCGFMISPNLRQVLLIRKDHPDWQAGKLNGVGGHVNDGEKAANAMEREFLEEAGIVWPTWNKLIELHNGGTRGEWCVHFYWTVPMEVPAIPRKTTTEPVNWYDIGHTADRLPNLRWLIPMAVSLFEGKDKASSFRVVEEY